MAFISININDVDKDGMDKYELTYLFQMAIHTFSAQKKSGQETIYVIIAT